MNVSTYAIPGIKREKPRKELTVDIILAVVSKKTGLTVEKIKEKNRHREIVEARQICMVLMKKYLRITLAEIGRYFGKDHTTVIHAIEMVNNLRETDERFLKMSNIIENRLMDEA